MPAKPPRICPCGRVVPGGQRCACSTARQAEVDKRRPNARQRGYTTKWDKARAEFLALHPTCCRCGAPADTVDHRKPHRGDQALFWDRSNWAAMCRSCHSSGKQAEEKRAGQPRWYGSHRGTGGPSGIF